MGRRRDFKQEYARRVARGARRGLSRAQARGHARVGEPKSSDVRTPFPEGDRSAEAAARSGLGRIPIVAFGMACGVMLVALAYAASRADSAWASPVFWTGQTVVYAVPAVMLLIRRPVSRLEAVGVAWLVPFATYAITEAYSPLQFRFLDEFAHVRTAQSILTTHHLFAANPALAVSPQYPGLEIVTSALAALSHLTVGASGAIVIGLAHVLLCLGLYFLMLEVTRRRRFAALAVLIYSTQPHFQFFDSYFIYEVLALPFLLGSLLSVMKMLSAPQWRTGLAWGAVAVAAAAATIVTHHVTSYILVGSLIVIEVVQVVRHAPARRDWRLPALILLVVGLTGLWGVRVATNTLAYFTPIVAAVLHGIVPHGHGTTVTQPSGPTLDVVLEYVATAWLIGLFAMGIRLLWRARHRPQSRFTIAVALASISFVAALGVRLLGSEGSLLYGRAATYFMLAVSFPIALAVHSLRIAPPGRRPWVSRRLRFVPWPWVAVAGVVLLGLGGIASGWPPYYARLPGSFRVEAWERSVDQYNLDLAQWAATELPANNGVASDFVTASMLASLGHQAAPQNVASLFLTPTFSASARKLVKKEGIAYIVVDRRITQGLPEVGYYFTDDPRTGRYTSPISAQDLTKFNHIRGVSRVFEDGEITVYSLAGSLYTRAP